MYSTNFYINGQYSGDLGIYLVSMDTGLHVDPFLSDRELVTEKIPGNDVPYLYDVNRSPLKFSLTLSTLDDEWTFDKRRQIANIIDTDDYVEFYTEDDPEKRYFILYTGGVDLNYGAELTGYITINFVNDSPYSYSPYYTNTYDCSISDVTNITFSNNGDTLLYPELNIYKVGAGDLSIVNLSNGGKEFKFTGLADKENLYVDCLNHDIETDVPLVNRYNDFSFNYLEFVRGVNRLQVTGKCIIQMEYQFIYKG